MMDAINSLRGKLSICYDWNTWNNGTSPFHWSTQSTMQGLIWKAWRHLDIELYVYEMNSRDVWSIQ